MGLFSCVRYVYGWSCLGIIFLIYDIFVVFVVFLVFVIFFLGFVEIFVLLVVENVCLLRNCVCFEFLNRMELIDRWYLRGFICVDVFDVW